MLAFVRKGLQAAVLVNGFLRLNAQTLTFNSFVNGLRYLR